MRDQCIRRVEKALGREITAGEARNIDSRFQKALVQLARRDPAAWRVKAAIDRAQDAANAVADELIKSIELKKRRMAMTIQAAAKLQGYLDQQVLNGHDRSRSESLVRIMTGKYDGRNNLKSVEELSNGYFSDAIGRLSEATEAITPNFLDGFLARIRGDRSLEKALVDALHGNRNNPDVTPEVQKVAAAFQSVMEELRLQLNNFGGEVGKLKDYMPHSWSERLAVQRGREAFVDDFMKWVDRSVYVDADGRRFTDEEMRVFLEKSWESIALGGALKDREPTFGGQMKAKRHSAHRQLHLRADAAWEALSTYSEKNTLDAMFDKIRQMTRDVALVEALGPNPDAMFQTLRAYAEKHDAASAAIAISQAGTEKERLKASLQNKVILSQRELAQKIYDYIAGNDPLPVNPKIAAAFNIARSQQVAAKLGSAVLTATSDIVQLHRTALQNGLNPLQVALNSNLVWLRRSRKYLRRLGLMTDAVIGHSQRFAADNLTGEGLWAGRANKMATAVLQASGLTFVTDARRIGFTITMSDALGSMTRRAQKISDLSPKDQLVLRRLSVTQADWDVWRKAKLDSWGGNGKLLTAEGIRNIEELDDQTKLSAAAKLVGILHKEQDFAVLTPGARERVQLAVGRKGTVSGELFRSLTLFKSYPWTYMQRVMLERSRYAEDDAVTQALRGAVGSSAIGRKTVNAAARVGYVAGLAIAMTAVQAVVMWVKDLIAGKDPRSYNVMANDPHDAAIARSNVMRAWMAAGGLGVYGDYLFQETRDGPDNTMLETTAGPLIGSAVGALRLVQGNLVQKTINPEKDSNFGSEAIGFARANMPGANLWYTKALTDRFIWNKLVEQVDPGYYDKAIRRQERIFGTTYWWEPDEAAPERAPELSPVN